jgi:putative ABC transport system ATP-binding protein
MISIRDLQFEYPNGEFALEIDELTLRPQQSVVISGPSGSGKTTLLNLLAGVLPVEHGDIEVAGRHLAGLNDAERRLFRLQSIGQVFQDFQLIDYLDVRDNVLLPCRIHPAVRPTPALRSRAGELLEAVGLSTMIHRPVTRLSQGERQRVAICRALLLSPAVVLADEPTGNLDAENAQRITHLLLSEAHRSGAQLVMVTHDASLLPMFDRTIPFAPFVRRTVSAAGAGA